MYCPREDLKRAVLQSQATGRVSPELAAFGLKIASGLCDRMRMIGVNREDFAQDCQVLLCRILPKIKPEKSIFNFITTCFVRQMCGQYRRAKAWKERHHGPCWYDGL